MRPPLPPFAVRADAGTTIRLDAPAAVSSVFRAEFHTLDRFADVAVGRAENCIISIVAIGAGSFAIHRTAVEHRCARRNCVVSGRLRDTIESFVLHAVH